MSIQLRENAVKNERKIIGSILTGEDKYYIIKVYEL